MKPFTSANVTVFISESIPRLIFVERSEKVAEAAGALSETRENEARGGDRRQGFTECGKR